MIILLQDVDGFGHFVGRDSCGLSLASDHKVMRPPKMQRFRGHFEIQTTIYGEE